MPSSEYRVIVPRCEVVQIKPFESPFAGLEFGARHGFVVSRTHAVPRESVGVVIVGRAQYALLVADGEVVESDKLVGVIGEVGIEITVGGHGKLHGLQGLQHAWVVHLQNAAVCLLHDEVFVEEDIDQITLRMCEVGGKVIVQKVGQRSELRIGRGRLKYFEGFGAAEECSETS